MVYVKNSGGKIIGSIEITEEKIIIHSNTKDDLIINDELILEKVKSKDYYVAKTLFDEYYLTISEIAAILGVNYSTGRKILYEVGFNSPIKAGRRNSSYGAKFSDERLKNMSEHAHINHYSTYERTPEIRKRISDSLKEKYKTGELVVNSSAISKAWEDGKYKNAKMGRGIQGYFFSHKNNNNFYFRSLLELCFLVLIEENSCVCNYKFEPFVIRISDKERYTPDCLINNKYLIELKPLGFTRYTDKNRYCREVKAAYNYCVGHNYIFRVIYDKDIGFETSSYKKYLFNNPDIIEKYNIRFSKI